MARVNRPQTGNSLPSVLLVGLLALVLLLVACETTDSPVSDPSATAGAASSDAAAPVLKVYNWDTYIDPDILTSFEDEFGVTIDYQVFDSDQDVLDELRAGGASYDVIVPSDFIVAIMRKEGLLAPLGDEAIPNTENLDPTFISPVFDPGNRYCMPYQWGTVGIGYNQEATGREIESWADFFDPEFAGRVAFLDDYRTTMGVALLILGYSPNTTNPQQIIEATEFLKSKSAHIGAYTGDEGQDLLDSGEFDMVVEWSGDVFQVMEENPDIRYVIPAEGPFIDEEILNDPAIYPPEAVRERLFFLVDVNLAATQMYEQAWSEILAERS
jgi:spermidine/putrescine transport system substrate-binding protein